MGRGTSGIASQSGNSDSVLGRNSKVPSREEIMTGLAEYGGLPVKYHNDMSAEARNMDTEIWVSQKFFGYSEEDQRHILNHEVAHNLADALMSKNTGNWQQFSSKFITEKKVPEGSVAYERGQRTYFEGLYGDVGAIALSETVTRAITEYLDDPSRLRNRSRQAYNEIKKFMRGK